MFVTDGVMFVTDSVMFVTDGVMGWRVTLQLNDVASDLGIRKIGNDVRCVVRRLGLPTQRLHPR